MAMDHLKKKRRLAMEVPNPLSLPKEIIHRIQHFLKVKEAAQTTVLSKSWCSAWSTRPDLDLDQHYLSESALSEFAKKAIKRYEDLNLKIDSFKLWMDAGASYSYTELILKALQLGATDFQIDSSPSSYFYGIRTLVLPDELLRSQTLARLSLSDFIVDFRGKKDSSSSSNPNLNLKSLNLCRVIMAGDFMRDVASRWPLIEELTLERYPDDQNIVGELFFHHPERRDILDYILLWRCDALAHFTCLRQLLISDTLVWSCREYTSKIRRICSPSLECLRIRLLDGYSTVWNAEFDVPNIRTFEYEGSPLSRFKFKETNCKGWESNIRITGPNSRDVISCKWFSSLNTFVKMLRLSSSRVSLSMNVKNIPRGRRKRCFDGCSCRDGEAAVLENLRLEGGDAVSVAFVQKMISSCRPKLIYIEEQNVQLFEDLKLQPWLTLLDNAASTIYKEKKFVRFQLNSTHSTQLN